MKKYTEKILEPITKWLNERRPQADVPLCHFAKICLAIEPCDVLLIEGRSRVAEVIKLITQSPWSHAALYIGRIHEIENPRLKQVIQQYYTGSEHDQLIVESELGLGTVLRPITVYELEHIRICRPQNLSHADKYNVIRYALSCIGYSYNIRQTLDLARFLFPWHILPKKFRSSLFSKNIGDTTKTVCSTMIAESFNFVHFPILPVIKCDEDFQLKLYKRNALFCVPRDFDYSPYFEIIKYPFIDYISDKSSYRELPWQGEFDPEYEGSLESLKKDDAILNALKEKNAEKDIKEKTKFCSKPEMQAQKLAAKKKESKTPLH